MSKEFKNTDDLFQAVFTDDSAEVPAFVKQNIDRKLGFNRRKRGWAWFWSVFATLFASAGLIWIFNESNHTSDQVDSSGSFENFLQPENKTDNTASQNNPSSASQTPAYSKHESDYSNTGISHVTKNNQTPDDQGSQVSTPSDPNRNEPVLLSEKTKSTKKDIESKSGESLSSGEKNEFKNQKTKETGTLAMEPDQNKLFTYQNHFIQPLTVRMFEKQESKKNNLLTNLSLKNEIPSLAENRGSADLSAIPIERSNDYNPWMISATGGINFAKSNYTSNTPAEVILYQDSNADMPGFEGNLDVKYRLKNSLTFGTGAAISKLSENYNFFKQSINVDTTITWTYQDIYVYDSLLDSTIFIGVDSTSVTNYDSTTVTLYDASGNTTATYLHIPFSIGTQIILRKFRFDFYAAGRFNLLIKGSGAYIQNDALVNFSKANQVFKPWYFDLILGTAVYYQLFDKLYISGTFRYRPQIGNLYEGLSFNRAMQSYHIGAGLSWKF